MSLPRRAIELTVNGETHHLLVTPSTTLLETLRESLGLTGTKHGCELGECGACTVLVEGKSMLSCLLLTEEVGARPVQTVEGLQVGNTLDPLQESFAELGAAQCGYCTPGMLLSAKALLRDTPSATETEIKEALSGNLCRCTGYLKIVEAVQAVQTVAAAKGAGQ